MLSISAEAREDRAARHSRGYRDYRQRHARDGLARLGRLSASGIERLSLPPLPLASYVVIAADNDANGTGERAARLAAERWIAEGRKVRIALATGPGSDWNDVLLGKDRNEIGEACDAA